MIYHFFRTKKYKTKYKTKDLASNLYLNIPQKSSIWHYITIYILAFTFFLCSRHISHAAIKSSLHDPCCIFYTKFSLYTSGSFLIHALPQPNLIYIHGIFLYPLTLEGQQLHLPLPIAFFLLPTLSFVSQV